MSAKTNASPPPWEQVCSTLKSKIGETAFEAWLKPIRAKKSSSPDTLILELPNEFFKNWVVQHYDLLIKDALKEAGATPKVEYAIGHSELEKRGTPAAEKAVKSSMPFEKIKPAYFLNPKYTFENFVTGQSNRFTHAACLAIAESPAKAYNPLFIYGRSGLGKTHLMQAICHQIQRRNPKTKFFYTPSERFTNELINAIQHRSTPSFRAKFRNVDVLLIDDIQFISNKEATQEEFFHTFNTLYDNHKQIILTSDRPPKEIRKMEERLVSRFSWGLVTDIQPPNLETRIAILKKKVENEPIAIPNEVLFFIAETVKTNIRELEGALIRVIAYSLLEEKATNIETARTVLKNLFQETSKEIAVEDVQRLVAEHFKINTSDLKTKKRLKHIVWPRQIAMYLTRELTALSLPEIGQHFGGKDHSTVLHSIKKIQKDLLKNHDLKQILERITIELKQH